MPFVGPRPGTVCEPLLYIDFLETCLVTDQLCVHLKFSSGCACSQKSCTSAWVCLQDCPTGGGVTHVSSITAHGDRELSGCLGLMERNTARKVLNPVVRNALSSLILMNRHLGDAPEEVVIRECSSNHHLHPSFSPSSQIIPTGLCVDVSRREYVGMCNASSE